MNNRFGSALGSCHSHSSNFLFFLLFRIFKIFHLLSRAVPGRRRRGQTIQRKPLGGLQWSIVLALLFSCRLSPPHRVIISITRRNGILRSKVAKSSGTTKATISMSSVGSFGSRCHSMVGARSVDGTLPKAVASMPKRNMTGCISRRKYGNSL